MSRTMAFLTIGILILTSATGVVTAKLPASQYAGIHMLAREQQGRVKLAIANTSYAYKELTVEFGYYRLGKRIIEDSLIEVPPKTILVTTHPKVIDKGVSGYRIADTVYISDQDGRQISSTQIIGIHPATDHYHVERYLVPAGEEAVAYLETPDPKLGIDARIYLSIGKTFTLGDYTGNLMVGKVYQGGLEKERKPPLSDMEDPKDFYNYSYGWRGLVIRASTPKLKGVERLDFDIEKFISTPEGTARHGLSAPPILVYGPDMTLIEE